MPAKGVDISEMNGIVDFKALKSAGISFVIIRCGYGNDISAQDDKRFNENVKKAETVGLPWGCYLYSYATNTSMAKSEANHVLRLLNGRKPLYGVWYDVEDKSQGNADLTTICRTFCEAIEDAGLYCGIYSMVSWMNSKLNSPTLDVYDKWVAQWANECDYGKPYGMWQFTDHLNVGGKAFDGNWAYKDYPSIIGYEPTPMPDPDVEEEITYDQWKEYAERYRKELGNEPISDWAKEAVEWVKENKIMNGDSNGKFRPHDYITREEVAQVKMNEEEVFGNAK